MITACNLPVSWLRLAFPPGGTLPCLLYVILQVIQKRRWLRYRTRQKQVSLRNQMLQQC
ncbi:hypothetical protein BJX63DRAFT_282128 [Aspergillus granulosus]|uniref:Uncharacterized protein n=1 Tax=Aspergillus granulosus TaxID=176169 RepID=A0ABR4HZ10_9EURO